MREVVIEGEAMVERALEERGVWLKKRTKKGRGHRNGDERGYGRPWCFDEVAVLHL